MSGERIKPILTVIDTTGIRNYIFGSNHLRENIGASEIVSRATSTWVFEVLRTTGSTNLKGGSNETSNPFEQINERLAIEEDHLDAEVIYAGGGNTLILFKDSKTAIAFTQSYTKLLLQRAPGLEVVVAHSQEKEGEEVFAINSNDCRIRVVWEEVMQRVNEKKANRKLSAPLMGLAVTAQCGSTGGVASFNPLDSGKTDNERETLRVKYKNKYISAETKAKLDYFRPANKRLIDELLEKISKWNDLKQKVENESDTKFDVPYDFDNLGRSEGEASFIAVVHTDGNAISNRVKAVGNKPNVKTSREWIKVIRKFSQEIYEANLIALQKTLDLLLSRIDEGKGQKEKGKLFLFSTNDGKFQLGEELRKGKHYLYLPFRPLIFGGEDVAFVCDGRIALALTAYYLKQAEKRILDNIPLYTRAGVAIVKTHYPFARAYHLAEDLARSAKKRVKEVSEDGWASALDWHLAGTGLAGDVNEIRRREYQTSHGRLHLRPLSLQHTNKNSEQNWFQSWQAFSHVITHFFKKDWKEKRNKVKALRDALRAGSNTVKNFAALYRVGDLPRITDGEGKVTGEYGWDKDNSEKGDVCVWFDAIEMLDLFYPLEPSSETKKEEAQQA